MNHSDTIGALATAVSAAQAAMKPAATDSKSAFGGYADLASVWEAARGPLSANGLAVLQAFLPAADGYICVETLLAHSSGEWVSSVLTMPASAGNRAIQGAQAYGSAITYARRYSLAAILGIAPAGEDDDGTAASQPAAQAPRQAPQQAAATAPTRTKREALAELRATPGWIPAADDHEGQIALLNELLGRPAGETRITIADLDAARAALLARGQALVDVPAAETHAQAAGR